MATCARKARRPLERQTLAGAASPRSVFIQNILPMALAAVSFVVQLSHSAWFRKPALKRRESMRVHLRVDAEFHCRTIR